jgi:hypothetical protein
MIYKPSVSARALLDGDPNNRTEADGRGEKEAGGRGELTFGLFATHHHQIPPASKTIANPAIIPPMMGPTAARGSEEGEQKVSSSFVRFLLLRLL